MVTQVTRRKVQLSVTINPELKAFAKELASENKTTVPCARARRYSITVRRKASSGPRLAPVGTLDVELHDRG